MNHKKLLPHVLAHPSMSPICVFYLIKLLVMKKTTAALVPEREAHAAPVRHRSLWDKIFIQNKSEIRGLILPCAEHWPFSQGLKSVSKTGTGINIIYCASIWPSCRSFQLCKRVTDIQNHSSLHSPLSKMSMSWWLPYYDWNCNTHSVVRQHHDR